MTKKHINILIILGCVLALAVVGAILLLTTGKQEQEQGSLLVSEVNFNTVVAMSITEGDNSLSLVLKEKEWYVENTDTKIDQVKASSISTHLCYVYADKIIDSNIGELSEYGLSPAKLTAQIVTDSGEVHTFYYGISTIDKTSVFMKIEGDDKLYTVLNDHYKQLVSNISNLQDLNAPHIEESKLTQISFKGEKQIIDLVKSETGVSVSGWKITEPTIAPALPYVIETIGQTVSGLRLEEYLGEEYKDEYGINSDSSWLKCADSDGNALSITFGDDMNEYYTYCQVEGKEGYYLISKQKFEFVDFDVSDFIDNQLISNQQGITVLTIISDETNIALKSAGETFSLNDNAITQEDYNAIIKSICSISVNGVVDTDISSEPKYTITVRTSSLVATINLYEYRNSFYAIDYGDGANVYVPANDLDAMVKVLSDAAK